MFYGKPTQNHEKSSVTYIHLYIHCVNMHVKHKNHKRTKKKLKNLFTLTLIKLNIIAHKYYKIAHLLYDFRDDFQMKTNNWFLHLRF